MYLCGRLDSMNIANHEVQHRAGMTELGCQGCTLHVHPLFFGDKGAKSTLNFAPFRGSLVSFTPKFQQLWPPLLSTDEFSTFEGSLAKTDASPCTGSFSNLKLPHIWFKFRFSALSFLSSQEFLHFFTFLFLMTKLRVIS